MPLPEMITITPEQFHNEAENVNFSSAHTMGYSLAHGFVSPFVSLEELGTKLGYVPKEKTDEAEEFLQHLERQTQSADPSWEQKAGNWVSDMIGSSVNPLSLPLIVAGGGLGGIVAKGIARVGADLLPSAVGKLFAMQVANKSLGELGKKGLVNAGAFMGGALPQAISDNYDKNTGHIHFWGVAKEEAAWGGVGIALTPIAFAAGVIWGKAKGFRRGEKFEPPMPGEDNAEKISALDQSLKDKKITPEELKWYKDALENPHDTSLNDRSASILSKNGHAVDADTGNVHLKIMDGKDVENIQQASVDQLAANVPKDVKTNLTDYLGQNVLDNMRKTITENPQLSHGILSYINFISKKLENKPEEIEKIEKISDKHLKFKAKEKEELSNIQESLIEDGRTVKDFHKKEPYNRLLELSNTSKGAKGLLYKTNLINEYQRQEGFKNILSNVMKLVDNPNVPLTKVDNVKDYLKARIESQLGKEAIKEIKESIDRMKILSEIPSDPDARMMDNREAIMNSKKQSAIKEFKGLERKFKQFSKSDRVFKDLISCIEGKLNG